MPQEVVKRSGEVAPYDQRKVEAAVAKCLAAHPGADGGVHVPSPAVIARMVTDHLEGKHGSGDGTAEGAPTVEQVQDAVEATLLALGMRHAARRYMAYRDERAKIRPTREVRAEASVAPAGWGDFAHKIFRDRYAYDEHESWDGLADRVPREVFGAVTQHRGVGGLREDVRLLIKARQFLPAGRYLYAAGRPVHQVQNCLLTFVEDTREGWADHVHKHVMGLSTGAGMGAVYSRVRPRGLPLRRTGGTASGPIPLMIATNELGRGLRQGGNRRSALWAGLHWSHRDVRAFITVKDWPEEVRALKAANWEFPAPMDGTNISVILDDEFLAAYYDPAYTRTDPHHGTIDHALARAVYWATVRAAASSGDPGFSVDVGANAGEHGRNACVTGDTEILTYTGYRRIDECLDAPVQVWNGHEWSEVQPKVTGHNAPMIRLRFSSGQALTTTHNHVFWVQKAYSKPAVRVRAADLSIGDKLAKFQYPILDDGRRVCYAYSQGFISGDGMNNYKWAAVYAEKAKCIPYLHGTAGKYNQAQDSTTFRWNFDQHPKNFVPFGWDLRSRLEWLAGLMDTDGTESIEGGCQIGSIDHEFLTSVQKMLTTVGTASKVCLAEEPGIRPLPDGRGGTKLYQCQRSWRLLIGAVAVQDLKALGLRCHRLVFDKAPQRDASRFVTVESMADAGVEDVVYCFNEPKRHLGCFEGVVTGQCTEITTSDDSDICNIGSINLARIDTIEQFRRAVRAATAFLLAGSVYSDLPYPRVAEVREKNRRIGLGLMGVHEWLLRRGKAYGPDAELATWLDEYARSTEVAHEYADAWGISRPVKTRAMAPNGTIGIVAETTTCMEPLLTVAYKRRVKEGDSTWAQHVIDPCARRLIEGGVDPASIETAYSLAETTAGVERRVAFQAWFQAWVDHGIASTINIAPWGSPSNCEGTVRQLGETLLRYLPLLRGITIYPDGARGGQPITQVPYATATAAGNDRVYETGDVCDLTRGGSCGS